MALKSAFLQVSYPQQGAGGINRGLGQQLAGQVKVSFGLNSRQWDCAGN